MVLRLFFLFFLVLQCEKILTSRWNSVQLFAILYIRVKSLKEMIDKLRNDNTAEEELLPAPVSYWCV